MNQTYVVYTSYGYEDAELRAAYNNKKTALAFARKLFRNRKHKYDQVWVREIDGTFFGEIWLYL